MKKKLFFIINNFAIGGTEKFLASLITFLDKEIFDITVVTILGEGVLRKEFEISGSTIKIIGPRSYPKNSIIKLFFLVLAFFKLTVFIKKNKPDILVTSLWQADILGIFAAKISKVRKIIFIQHDIFSLNPIALFLKKKFIAKFSTDVVAISGDVKEFLKKYFNIVENKIIIINNGVNREIFRPLPLNKEGLVFGSISRLEQVKGHQYIINALYELQKQNITPKVLIYGDGSLREKLEIGAEKLNLENLFFEGDEVDQTKALAKIDVFLAPSISEGFGLAILEALMSGKIVVSSDLPAVREFIVHESNGILIPKENTLALASVIKKVIEDRNYVRMLEKGISNWLINDSYRFDIRNVAKRYSQLFLN